MIFLRNESLSAAGGGSELTEGLILDLDFNGNYIDKSPAGLVLTGGNSAGTNPPTFVPGRKVGTFCANFNGSQSLRTTSNLPLNSDKVTVSFWMKTTQTNLGIIAELSPNFNYSNAFATFINDQNKNKIEVWNRQIYNENNIFSDKSINTGNWLHFLAVIDRELNVFDQIKIYFNGYPETFFKMNSDSTIGDFINNILFIGQRDGSSLGFNGQLQNFQVRNIALTDAQALQLYNSQL